MKKINLLVVGKAKTDYVDEGLAYFERRINFATSTHWYYLPHQTSDQPEQIRQRETTLILDQIAKLDRQTDPSQNYLILLDERGRQFTTPQLAAHWQNQQDQGQTTFTFIIGGAYGVTAELLSAIKARHGLIWSLSELVFPHQLVRLILLEQIYRCQSLWQNKAYHHQ